MAIKKTEGIQTIYICDKCCKEIFRVSPKGPGLSTPDMDKDEFDEKIKPNLNYDENYFTHDCGARHRLIFQPRKEGSPLSIELGEMI